MKKDLDAVSALGYSKQKAQDEGREWDVVDAYEAVAPLLRGPSDAAMIAFIAILLGFIAFVLWLVFA